MSTTPTAQEGYLQINHIRQSDPELAAIIEREYTRQARGLEMIASENYTSAAVLEAQGCVMTNKYAEGLPSKRYYGGCEFVDQAEDLAIERAKELFDAQCANVQPHSGSSANIAVYFALLQPGDKILGMDLAHGGHLTHGMRLNFSGKVFEAHGYQLSKETESLDYDAVARTAREVKPKLLISGWSAYPRIVDFAKMKEIAEEVGAIHMTDMAHFSGLVAGGVHPSPVPHSDIVTSTTHKTLRGPRSGFILMTEEYAQPINKSVFPGMQGGPLMHVIAAKAVAFGECLQPEFKKYAQQILDNAQALGEALKSGGVRLVTGGTDTHLLLCDLTPLGITGKAGEAALERAAITVNKNMIPFDTQKPMVTSGIRIGTPALTTRGMQEDEMRKIGGWICQALKSPEDEALLSRIRAQVEELCNSFPLHDPNGALR
ncbi:serine hydroxymethyltransferase [Candidatus Sumerlaeota bacterium]|nr:serine hydroxymethyltransferase [Candidatus Sumerlaeota bacterium]